MKKIIGVFLVILATLAFTVVSIRTLRHYGEFVIHISNGGSIVVDRTDCNAFCGPFNVSNTVASGVYILGSCDDSKGVYTVIFRDTTRLPGRFTISIAGSTMDIMSRGVIFDKKEVQWNNRGRNLVLDKRQKRGERAVKR